MLGREHGKEGKERRRKKSKGYLLQSDMLSDAFQAMSTNILEGVQEQR